MLTQKPTKKLIANWKAVHKQYKDKLCANCKSAAEILDYIKSKYTLSEYKNFEGNQVYGIERDIKSVELYENQDDIFKQCEKILFYFTDVPQKGFFSVEGSSALWNEILAVRGLTKEEINNYYLVAEYISCLKKYDPNNVVLKK